MVSPYFMIGYALGVFFGVGLFCIAYYAYHQEVKKNNNNRSKKK